MLLELESAETKVEGRAINKSNWKAVMKFERISLICEESTYLVNTEKELYLTIYGTKKMMTENLADL